MNIPFTDQKTLCICLTPLHVLIAKRVAETLGHTFDVGIYLSYQDDQRQKNYGERMGEFCKQIKFDLLPKEQYRGGMLKYLDLHRLRRSQIQYYSNIGEFDVVVSSCSINQHLWCLLSAVSPSTLLTYDDGLMNLQSKNLTYSKTTSIQQRLLLRLSGVTFHTEKLLDQSAQHFSIYRDKNWFKNSDYIPLLGQPTSDDQMPLDQAAERILKIFLGPAPEYPAEMWAKVETHLQQNPDSLYLPHPRDAHVRFPFVRLLTTDLIVEDYVAEALRNDPGLSIEITGTESSALINLSGQARVKTRSILTQSPNHQEAIELLKRHGVELPMA